jgi:hypothetical protein
LESASFFVTSTAPKQRRTGWSVAASAALSSRQTGKAAGRLAPHGGFLFRTLRRVALTLLSTATTTTLSWMRLTLSWTTLTLITIAYSMISNNS